jgi:hypothetical protein
MLESRGAPPAAVTGLRKKLFWLVGGNVFSFDPYTVVYIHIYIIHIYIYVLHI